MVWIDISQIEEEPLQIDLSEPIESFSILESELLVKDTIEVHGELNKIEDKFLLTGALDANLIFTCDRCLEEYLFPLHLDLQILFLLEEEEGGPKGDKEEDLELYIFSGDSIDLGSALRETILLSLPMKKLCSEGCLGLCPNCGVNFNLSSCNCNLEEVDPRLEILKQLKSRMAK